MPPLDPRASIPHERRAPPPTDDDPDARGAVVDLDQPAGEAERGRAVPGDDEPPTEQRRQPRESRADWQKRLNREVAKTHGERRRADAIAAENAELKRKLAAMSGASFEAAEAANKDAIEAARREHKAALESGDADRITEAAEKIADAKADAAAIRYSKARRAEEPAEERPKPNGAETETETRERPNYTRRTQAWIDDNPWFEDDRKLRDAAASYARVLEAKGVKADTDAYFEGIDKFMRAEFPDEFPDTEDGGDPPVPGKAAERRNGVAPVGQGNLRRNAQPGTLRISLTAQQIEHAKAMGTPQDEYALGVALQDSKISREQYDERLAVLRKNRKK